MCSKNAKCKECHKIGHFHKVCQSKKRGRRANLAQIAPKPEQDTHIDENGVRQPNPPMVNMLKIVNHIGATRGSQEKHLKFPIDVDPRGPYKHHLVVRVDIGADVNCMNEKTFKKLFPKVKLSVCPHEIQNFGNRHFYTGTVSHLLAVQGRKVLEYFHCHQHQQLPQSTQPWSNLQNGCITTKLPRGECSERRKCT